MIALFSDRVRELPRLDGTRLIRWTGRLEQTGENVAVAGHERIWFGSSASRSRVKCGLCGTDLDRQKAEELARALDPARGARGEMRAKEERP